MTKIYLLDILHNVNDIYFQLHEAMGGETYMSIVSMGGNDCMKRRYINACKDCGCKAKVFIHMEKDLTHRIGSPDLIILFTSTASHQLAMHAMDEARKSNAIIEHCRSSSLTALQNILRTHCLDGIRV